MVNEKDFLQCYLNVWLFESEAIQNFALFMIQLTFYILSYRILQYDFT